MSRDLTNSEAPAYPVSISTTGPYNGLSKRELIAAMVLEGMVVSDSTFNGRDALQDDIIDTAVVMADKLLTRLEKSHG